MRTETNENLRSSPARISGRSVSDTLAFRLFPFCMCCFVILLMTLSGRIELAVMELSYPYLSFKLQHHVLVRAEVHGLRALWLVEQGLLSPDLDNRGQAGSCLNSLGVRSKEVFAMLDRVLERSKTMPNAEDICLDLEYCFAEGSTMAGYSREVAQKVAERIPRLHCPQRHVLLMLFTHCCQSEFTTEKDISCLESILDSECRACAEKILTCLYTMKLSCCNRSRIIDNWIQSAKSYDVVERILEDVVFWSHRKIQCKTAIGMLENLRKNHPNRYVREQSHEILSDFSSPCFSDCENDK